MNADERMHVKMYVHINMLFQMFQSSSVVLLVIYCQQ